MQKFRSMLSSFFCFCFRFFALKKIGAAFSFGLVLLQSFLLSFNFNQRLNFFYQCESKVAEFSSLLSMQLPLLHRRCQNLSLFSQCSFFLASCGVASRIWQPERMKKREWKSIRMSPSNECIHPDMNNWRDHICKKFMSSQLASLPYESFQGFINQGKQGLLPRGWQMWLTMIITLMPDYLARFTSPSIWHKCILFKFFLFFVANFLPGDATVAIFHPLLGNCSHSMPS